MSIKKDPMNSEDPGPNKRKITGLNFKEIVKNVETNNEVSEGNLFIRDVDAYTSSTSGKVQNSTNRAKRFSKIISNRLLPVKFIMELSNYLVERTRVIFVLSSVLIEVITKSFESSKRFLIRKMFWGRSNLFRFSVQFISVLLIVVVLVSGVYKSGRLSESFVALSSDQGAVYASSDVIIQNSSTKTQFSENAFISQPITYIVKRNDTVSTIAEENGISIDTVLWANDLSYTDVLKPGTELRIPRADGVLTTVRKGDTLESLADEYSTNPQLILEANWGLEPNENGEYILTVGEELFLPDGEIPEPEPIIADKPTSSGTTKYTGVLTPPKAGGTDTKVSKKRFLGWPVKGSQGYLSQCYSGWHNGVDIASVGNSKPDLAAAADGVVSFAGCQSGYCPPPGTEYGGSGLAWTVMIDHGNGLTSIYGHMNDIYVSSGQRVVAGQSIGQMGQSGLAYGVHVHFMLVKSGTWTTYNPAAYMVNSVCGY